MRDWKVEWLWSCARDDVAATRELLTHALRTKEFLVFEFLLYERLTKRF